MMNQHDAPRSTAETTGTWELLDFDRGLATASTWEGIESALLAIPERASSPNAIATLVAPNGDTLSIGIASPLDGDNPGLDRPLSCVEFNQASQEPPYLVVVGDPSLTAKNGGVVVFPVRGAMDRSPSTELRAGRRDAANRRALLPDGYSPGLDRLGANLIVSREIRPSDGARSATRRPGG
jgi:hypothetical protein